MTVKFQIERKYLLYTAFLALVAVIAALFFMVVRKDRQIKDWQLSALQKDLRIQAWQALADQQNELIDHLYKNEVLACDTITTLTRIVPLPSADKTCSAIRSTDPGLPMRVALETLKSSR